MGTTLNGTTPQNTYPSLIKVGNNTALSATAKYLSDGEGNDSILSLSTDKVGIGTSAPTQKLDVDGRIVSRSAIDNASSPGESITMSITGYSPSQFSNSIFNSISGNPNSLMQFRVNSAPSTQITAMTLLGDGNVSIGTSTSMARLGIKGSGTTAATTSLLVQNSSATQMLKLSDDGQLNLNSALVFDVNTGIIDGSAWYQSVNNSSVNMYGDGGASSGVRVTGSTNGSGASQIQIKGATSISSGFNQPDASAQLDVSTTTKGFLPPRMTTTQKNAISSPAAGLQVYDITLNQMSYYNGTTWVNI